MDKEPVRLFKFCTSSTLFSLFFTAIAFGFQLGGNQQTKEQHYKLVVSFGSACCGINRTAADKLDKFRMHYYKENKIYPAAKESNWGKEGERYLCFTLSELNSKKQDEFILNTKELLKNESLISVEENAVCRHNR